MKTRRNIYYNLEESPFITKFKDFKFYFSSKFYQNKFENELFSYIEIEKLKFKNKYNVNIDIDEILSFNLYRRIEKRGCYCVYHNNAINNYIIKGNLNAFVQIKE